MTPNDFLSTQYDKARDTYNALRTHPYVDFGAAQLAALHGDAAGSAMRMGNRHASYCHAIRAGHWGRIALRGIPETGENDE